MHPARIRDRDLGHVAFKIVRFEYSDRPTAYVGIAHNYDIPALVTTAIAHPSYAQAKDALEQQCAAHGLSLRWFDGEYVSRDGAELLVNAPTPEPEAGRAS